jgi:hypothetical protein
MTNLKIDDLPLILLGVFLLIIIVQIFNIFLLFAAPLLMLKALGYTLGAFVFSAIILWA